jgi:hypothetical protein
MVRAFQEPIYVLNAVTATGVGTTLDVRAFKTIVLEFHTTGSANFTAKIQGSSGIMPGANFETQAPAGTAAVSATTMLLRPPVWANAASPTNPWTYIQSISLADGTTFNGAAGIAATGTDINLSVEVNTNGISYLTVDVTAYSAGAITCLCTPYNVDE